MILLAWHLLSSSNQLRKKYSRNLFQQKEFPLSYFCKFFCWLTLKMWPWHLKGPHLFFRCNKQGIWRFASSNDYGDKVIILKLFYVWCISLIFLPKLIWELQYVKWQEDYILAIFGNYSHFTVVTLANWAKGYNERNSRQEPFQQFCMRRYYRGIMKQKEIN